MLFELMVVTSLVLFVCGIVFLSYSSSKRISFVRESSFLKILFRTAITRALCVKSDQQIIIDPEGAALWYDGQRYPLAEGYLFDVLPGTYGPPSLPKKLVKQAITFKDNRIIAYPDGTMQAGTLYITNNQTQYAITTPVSAFTYMRVYHYHNGSWQKYS